MSVQNNNKSNEDSVESGAERLERLRALRASMAEADGASGSPDSVREILNSHRKMGSKALNEEQAAEASAPAPVETPPQTPEVHIEAIPEPEPVPQPQMLEEPAPQPDDEPVEAFTERQTRPAPAFSNNDLISKLKARAVNEVPPAPEPEPVHAEAPEPVADPIEAYEPDPMPAEAADPEPVPVAAAEPETTPPAPEPAAADDLPPAAHTPEVAPEPTAPEGPPTAFNLSELIESARQEMEAEAVSSMAAATAAKAERAASQEDGVIDTEMAASVAFPVGWLVVCEGPGTGEAFALTNGLSTIGRRRDQSVPLHFGDLAISRENHASVFFDTETNLFTISQSGKANLVRLNDRPLLADEHLGHGDRIRLGETTLIFAALCGDAFAWPSLGEEGAQ